MMHAGRLSQAQDAADAAVRDARRGAPDSHVEASIVRSLVGLRGHINDAAADAHFAVDAVPPATMRTPERPWPHWLIADGTRPARGRRDVMERAVRS
jgi:hypothetical protein